jgi:NAD(P)-dependent dehydrogenase (short-subunit alcohol dehydrogenase family)
MRRIEGAIVSTEPVFLILGGSGGIGSALARKLRDQNARLILAARDEARLQAIAQETGGESFSLDATIPGEVERCAEQVCESHGRLDGIANCVGSVLLKPAHLTSDEDWNKTLQLNLGTAFATVRAAGKFIRGAGSVVVFSSAAASIGLANHEAIAAAKGGVEGLMRSAAATYSGRGLRFNAVAPGLVETPLTKRITGSAAGRKASEAMHPLGRLGQPEDVASIAAWLLGASSGWVTGQVFGVDGGLAALKTREG